MPDPEWLRNLAEARDVQGSWQVANPAAVRELIERRIKFITSELQEQAEDYAATLSRVTSEKLNVRVLPHEIDAPDGGGLLLLLGKCQISVTRQGSELIVRHSSVHGFERKAGTVQRYKPAVDALGAVYWRMDNTLLMPCELIIKRLFEELVRAARTVDETAEGG